MAHSREWDRLIEGIDCPLDAPRPARNQFWIEVCKLSASTLYLDRNQAYRGQCVLIFDPRHVTRLEALTDEEYREFMEDMRRAARSIIAVCQPDHMNYASLGNVIPHLHWHIIPRYRDDPRWRKPIWTHRHEMPKVHLAEEKYEQLAKGIRQAILGPPA